MTSYLSLVAQQLTPEEVAEFLVKTTKARLGDKFNVHEMVEEIKGEDKLRKVKDGLLRIIYYLKSKQKMLADFPGKSFDSSQDLPLFVDRVYAHLSKAPNWYSG